MKVSKLELTNIRGYENAQIEFSPGINIIVGENNSGKTTILRTLLFLQDKNSITSDDIRKDKKKGKINLFFNGDTNQYFDSYINQLITDNNNQLEIEFEDNFYKKILINGEKYEHLSISNNTSLIKDTEEQNFIYPFLSKRKVTKYNEEVGEYYANKVLGNFSNLYAKVDRISGDGLLEKDEFVRVCEKILGFRISSSTANYSGKKATYVINSSQNISLEIMGEGVANIVGLILDLCVAKDKLFIMEEPENDIHPKALKKLLDFIIEKSHNNQFLITTHSNIVLKYLGSARKSKIFHVKMEIPDHKIPTSSISEIDDSPKARREILEDLGYELFDFDIWDTWLILEESSAETVIKDFLIPNFVPKLKGRIKTCSSTGVDKVSARVEALYSLCLFLHLQDDSFKDKIWVLIDEGEKEQKIIEKLRNKYKSWKEDHFHQLKEHEFEKYYPEEFQEEVDKLKIMDGQEKRKQKEVLLEKVKQWWIKNPELAKEGFRKSAHEVIEFLINIQKSLSEY
ncbi:AAA family ATPase [Anabaena cylindrica UHCC 0172]|uniref:ATP-dependent nuclease n=1 Tax=Anabaena cylindrica TaxID=1165 RepID=UPI002B1E9A0F|nr:AAA family ATPase [Anabaena cylindrica]MEA5549473.1 AAA family ATPase [Anabaena cylindrica UHCC 0172]